MKLLSFLGALLAAVTCAECVTVCYYGGWATYRPGNGKVDIEDIDPNMCTHLVYAFVGVDSDEGVITIMDPWADLCNDGGLCGFQRFNDRKKQNPDLKTLLAVGGWNEGSADFSIVAGDEEKRKTFAKSAVELLKVHNFDGLDMDWEYPGSRNGSSTDDKANFILLLSELRSALSAEGKLLTAAVAAGQDTIDLGYDVPGMAANLDYIFLMAYDMFGPWDNFTHHNAPLVSHPLDKGNDTFSNVDYSVNYWLDLGTPAEKLVLGLGMYGRCWSLPLDTLDPGFYTPAYEHGPAGPYTGEEGFLGYNELCEKQKKENWTKLRDPEIDEAYAYYDDGEQIVWCGYDDERSIRVKASYARAMGLGGVMVWSLETDDVHGICHSKEFPLIKAADEVFHDKEAVEKKKVMSCYYANYARYRPEKGKVVVPDITDLADVCTHLIYAFANVNDITGEMEVGDPNADLCGDEGGQFCGYKDFTDFKKNNHNLKTLIAVGGYGDLVSGNFTKVAADDTLRATFVQSVLTFLRKHNFDGLDVDWEYPGADDKENFMTLLSDLDTAFLDASESFLLTVAVPVAGWRIDAGYDVPSISSHVDLIHIMAYDFHGAWGEWGHIINHNAPLYQHHTDFDDTLTVNWAINKWMTSGAPADKLVLGLPMYGRCWKLDDPSQHDVGANGTVGPAGTYSREAGVLYYSDICKSQMSYNDWVLVNDKEMKVSYGYSLLYDNTWCGYDDETSIETKTIYAHDEGLAGIMIWAVDQDDAHNECTSPNFRDSSLSFPLTRKAKEVQDTLNTTPAPTTNPTTSANTDATTAAISGTPESTTTTTTEVTETTSSAFSPTPAHSLATISASLLMVIITKLIV